MATNPSEKLGVLAGSVLVSLGAGTAALFGFSGQYMYTYTGLLSFAIGYELIDYITTVEKSAEPKNLRGIVHGTVTDPIDAISALVLTGVGIASITEGILVFSGVILAPHPSTTSAIMAGIMCFGGYVVAHIGVNQSVI